jgi:uncharacterized membrane protein
MQSYLKEIAEQLELLIEAAALAVVVVGVAGMLFRLLVLAASRKVGHGARRMAWLSLARWLVLALELQLAADIIGTAIAPSWDDIGQLAAIGGIRTFLNFFLEKDLAGAEREASSEA